MSLFEIIILQNILVLFTCLIVYLFTEFIVIKF